MENIDELEYWNNKLKPPTPQKTESIVFSNDENIETLFEKVKAWEIHSQLKFAIDFDESKRTELFNKIIEDITDEEVKQNVLLVKQRIDKAAFQIQ